MGETGCGKTRLIRYMCDLARQGKEKRKKKNMLILKVYVHSVCSYLDLKLSVLNSENTIFQTYFSNTRALDSEQASNVFLARAARLQLCFN